MNRRTGFTLVELVVVIMILGILAGVAAPKMFDTAGRATDNGLRQTLSIVRDAIELYTASPDNPNPGEPPVCADADGQDFRDLLIPYIRGEFPFCPVGGNVGDPEAQHVAPMDETDPSDDSTGWRYDAATGSFSCNYAAETASMAGTNYDEL